MVVRFRLDVAALSIVREMSSERGTTVSEVVLETFPIELTPSSFEREALSLEDQHG